VITDFSQTEHAVSNPWGEATHRALKMISTPPIGHGIELDKLSCRRSEPPVKWNGRRPGDCSLQPLFADGVREDLGKSGRERVTAFAWRDQKSEHRKGELADKRCHCSIAWQRSA
jgi:hypothetical protein